MLNDGSKQETYDGVDWRSTQEIVTDGTDRQQCSLYGAALDGCRGQLKHRRRNRGAEGAAAPPTFRAGGHCPRNVDGKISLKKTFFSLFGICVHFQS